MKLTIPAPVNVCGQSYGLLEMARFLTRKERRYNQTADAARSGARVVAALEAATGNSADVQESDLRLFSAVVEKPHCGWGVFQTKVEFHDPRTQEKRVMERPSTAPTVEFLPLIDSVANDARALPPLPTK
jgi:hypothetical protein